MNILGKEQEKIFEDGISCEELEQRKKEFLELYFKFRKKEEEQWYSKLTLEQRKKLHSLILKIYKLKNKLGGFTYELIKDERETTDRPIIYVPTHIGKFDIENISEAIGNHYYLLSGDFEHIQGIIDAPFLAINGVFYFNEKVKEDRKQVTEKMINHLLNGGNLLYFVEGTWNLTPNLPVLPVYWGIVDIAKKTNAIIIPIGVEQYDKNFKINIGRNFDFNIYGDSYEEKTRAINDLRDTLATLKWEIWETEKATRESLDYKVWEEYINERFAEWPGFNKAYIQSLIFRPKNVVTPKDVFEQLMNLDLENATRDNFISKLQIVNYAKKRVKIYEKFYF